MPPWCSATNIYNPLTHEILDPERVEVLEAREVKFGKRMLRETEVQQSVRPVGACSCVSDVFVLLLLRVLCMFVL